MGLQGFATVPAVAPVAPLWPIMAPDAYHGVVGEIVRTLEPHTEADPAAILIQLLVATGNAVGRGPFFQIEGDLHFTKLNVAVVGATSGGRKGTSLGRVLQVMELADPTWTQNCVKSGLASGEGLIHHVRDPPSQRKMASRKNLTLAFPKTAPHRCARVRKHSNRGSQAG